MATGKGVDVEWYRVRASCALISLGILDGFHAFVIPGQSFVWLHSAANLFGGLLFAIVWVPRLVKSKFTWPILTFVLCIAFGSFSLLFPEIMSAMLQEGRFTFAAETSNLIGGAGFLLAAMWFLRKHHDSPSTYFVLFANFCLLFGSAAIIFHFSRIWDMQWWLWHAIRLTAYLIALLLIFEIYLEEEKEKNRLIADLEKAISEIKTLYGIIPICSHCKQIRDDKGAWNQLESYMHEHSDAEFTHGICPDCMKKHYGVVLDKN